MLNLFRTKRSIVQPLAMARIQESVFSHIIDELPGAIFVKDIQNEYRLCFVNREAENFFSYKREQMIGKRDADLFSREEADFFHAIDRQVVESGKIMDIPCERITTSQGIMLLHTRKVPISDENGNPRYLLGLAQDITERVHNEQELLEYKEALEKKVYERTQKLAEATKKAEEANRLKSEFLATMSHEIRSPMSGVLGMAELLLETNQTVEQANLTKTIINCGEALLNVIEDILDFSKIEANRMEVHPIAMNMHELVDDVCTLYSSKAREKALELVVRYVPGTEQFVYADPVRVRQILSNLINNAIKFTKKGHIVVTVREGQKISEDGLALEFCVQDTGIGIAAVEQEHIFDKFAQVDASATRSYGGTGLGLSISKRLAELMGGDITVDSRAGEGAAFTFVLPVIRNTKDVFIQSEPPSLKDVRLLVVDDLPIVTQLIDEQMTLAGMRVDRAVGGKEALLMMKRAAAQGDPYKIALVDYLMPSMNGEVLARAISDVPEIADTCLIMMTAAGNPIVGDDAAKKGFSAYISKPVRRDVLVDMMAHVWTQYQSGLKDVLIRVDTLNFGKEKTAEDDVRLDSTTILLAEDSRINQAFAQEVLETMGCRLIIASNGSEALNALDANKDISLVLMDCQMPVMDGFEASRIIAQRKKDGILPDSLPVIALTANAMEGDRERCIEAGMNDYLSKPVRRKDLRQTVYRWVAREIVDHRTADDAVLMDVAINAEARHVMGGKYDMMVEFYEEDAEKYIGEIRQGIDKKQVAHIVRPAHTLKSNSRSLGLVRMADLAAALEVKALAMNEGRIALSFKDLSCDLDAIDMCFAQSISLLSQVIPDTDARQA